MESNKFDNLFNSIFDAKNEQEREAIINKLENNEELIILRECVLKRMINTNKQFHVILDEMSKKIFDEDESK